jgi:uracil-DNA glycosylase
MDAKTGSDSNVCRWYGICPMRRYQAAGLVDDERIDPYCLGDWASCVRFQKESRGESHPDNMLPDGAIDENLP